MNNNAIYVIAEMACSHDGQAALARRIIDAAGTAGANAIQFQIWRLEDIMVPTHPDFSRVLKLQLASETWAELAVYTRSRHPGMEIIACVYDPAAADFADALNVNAFKIHTADLSNPQLLRHIAAKGKRIDLSVGASSLDEIGNALATIRAVRDVPIWLMYGMQNFPTNVGDAHLAFAAKLADLFELPVGYQDHTDAQLDSGFWLPAAAVGMGIRVIEKHITHDRSRKGADHEAALNPEEFEKFVRMLREIEVAFGSPVPRPFSEADQRYRKYSKKSIVATRDLPAGTVLAETDLTVRRAEALGLPPDQSARLVGRVVRAPLKIWQLVRDEDLS
jgi:sialic acid synthase SpsE